MVLKDSSERDLGLHLIRFTEIFEQALSGFKLHVLCDYLYQLASKFHIFYTQNKVCGSTEETSRLLLCEATVVVMKKCFDLIGIEPPARV
ncbi:hypothetical protein Ddye_020529 [Dipteronia dyeriana]|uniref:arginine--tRNA ligase n=1 Tax=Dipteronia dyeriana TaxID=168575 RepID=A0AAD9U0Y6_9ROSI|nr:hypothetical protein Ddye_020529 [Dipteronia dyeriana]